MRVNIKGGVRVFSTAYLQFQQSTHKIIAARLFSINNRVSGRFTRYMYCVMNNTFSGVEIVTRLFLLLPTIAFM